MYLSDFFDYTLSQQERIIVKFLYIDIIHKIVIIKIHKQKKRTLKPGTGFWTQGKMKVKYIILIAVTVLVIIAGLMFGLPLYNVWQQEMSGKAEMAKAEQNRQILVEEAKAKLEAERLNAQAEIERAKGMAQAMEIENGKLTSTYNQYLFIRTLEKISDKGSLPQTIYIPTEGMLPVMDVAASQGVPGK